MPTPCLRFHWLRWHRVSVFNNHVRMVNESADIMSALVNSYFSLCLYSQWLRRHTIFENIKLHFLLLFCLFILSGAEVEFCDKKVSKISWHCPLNKKIISGEKSDEFVQPHGPKNDILCSSDKYVERKMFRIYAQGHTSIHIIYISATTSKQIKINYEFFST